MDNTTNGTLAVATFHESDAMKYVISVMWPLALLEWLYCTYMVWPFLFSCKKRLPLGRFRLLVTCAYSSSSMSCWLTRFCMFLGMWTSQSEDGMFDMCPWLYFGALMVPEAGIIIVGNMDLIRVSRVMSQGRSLGARRGCGWTTLLVGTAIVVVCVYLRMVLGITDMMNLCQPDQMKSPVAMEFSTPAPEEQRAYFQSPFYFHTEWPAWLLETFVLFFTMPVTSGIALLHAWKIGRDQRSAAAAAPSNGRDEIERAAEANTQRRARNMSELNRGWWQLVRAVSGTNFTLGIFVSFVVIFQINAKGKPEMMEAVHALGCAACAMMLLSQTLYRLVIIRSLCARGRNDPGSKYVAWASQLESGVLATLLSENLPDAKSLGTPAQVAHAGMERCRAVRLSSFGPSVFHSGEARTEADQSKHSFACLRPDFFISHSWRDDPDDKYRAVKLICDRFEEENGFEPTLWIDKYCIDQAQIGESLRYLPVYVAASSMVVLLIGPTYLSRLWCLWELFVIHSTRSLRDAIYWSIAPFTIEGDILDLARNFSVDQAESFSNTDKDAIVGMINKFSNGGSAAFERKMVEVVHAIVDEKTGRAIGGGRRLLPKAYSMRDVAQKSKAPESDAGDTVVRVAV
jgi:hypothetical protein